MAPSQTNTYPYPSTLNVANFVSLKLTPNNYLFWRTQMAALIESQDMQGFLGDEYNMPAMTIKVPDGTDAMGSKEVSNPAYISQTFEEVLGIVVGLTTAHNVWNALEEAYAQDSQEREFNLNQAVTLQRKGDDSLG
ncbi:hypothetical protein SLE2022_367350 [Rubroshorea leprosula]